MLLLGLGSRAPSPRPIHRPIRSPRLGLRLRQRQLLHAQQRRPLLAQHGQPVKAVYLVQDVGLRRADEHVLREQGAGLLRLLLRLRLRLRLRLLQRQR